MKKLKMWLFSAFVAGAGLLQTVSASELGDKAQNLATTAETEALGLAEVVGLIGVVGCGILLLVGQKDLAKRIIVGVVIGYVILKYASPLWNVIKNGV